MLEIKEPLEKLEIREHGITWPGDSAVDLEASDLTAWAKSLGQEGLVLKAGAKASAIRVRPLSIRELNRALKENDAEQHAIAAKYGVLSVEGLELSRDVVDSLGGLSRGSVDLLMHQQLRGPVKWFRLLDEMLAARGRGPLDVTEKVRDTVVPTELGYALGVICLALSFRLG